MKAAVKFCGGCNPGYDRTEYWESIRDASDGRIEWVAFEDCDCRAVLLICGCETACPRDDLSRQHVLVSVTDNTLSAASVISLLQTCSERGPQDFKDPAKKGMVK